MENKIISNFTCPKSGFKFQISKIFDKDTGRPIYIAAISELLYDLNIKYVATTYPKKGIKSTEILIKKESTEGFISLRELEITYNYLVRHDIPSDLYFEIERLYFENL